MHRRHELCDSHIPTKCIPFHSVQTKLKNFYNSRFQPQWIYGHTPMRAVLRLAARRKPLSRSFLCQQRSFVQSQGIDNQYRTPTLISLRQSSTNVADESQGSSANFDLFDAKDMANADLSILLSKLNLGLKSGSMSSNQILSRTVSLLSRGCVIPTSFFLDAGEESRLEWMT
jgi:hypothetical protein